MYGCHGVFHTLAGRCLTKQNRAIQLPSMPTETQSSSMFYSLSAPWFVQPIVSLVSAFSPRGVTPTSKFVCVLPFPDGDARRHRDLSWFGQEKALGPAGERDLYYLAPKCLYRGEYRRGVVCVFYCVCV